MGTHETFASATIQRFVAVDLVGALALLIVVSALNVAVVRSGLLWSTSAALACLAACLIVAGRRSGETYPVLAAIVLIFSGHALVAVVTPIALPFLWPMLVVSIVIPLVLAAPFVSLRALIALIAATAAVAAVSALIGLRADDAGAVPDIDDDLELFVVVAALAVLMVPIGLVVWQNNRSQRRSLDEALALNTDLTRSRRRVVEASDDARRRIERDLHDGAQQRLVALAMKLRTLDAMVDDERASVDRGTVGVDMSAELSGLVDAVEVALSELRDLAHGVYPPVLAAHGLGAALTAVARGSGGGVSGGVISVDDRTVDESRPPQHVEEALYFATLEAIANSSKHAPTGAVKVVIRREPTASGGDRVAVTVSDDGPGFDLSATANSSGLDNMRDRVESVDGTFGIESTPGRGTTVTLTGPAEDRQPGGSDDV